MLFIKYYLYWIWCLFKRRRGGAYNNKLLHNIMAHMSIVVRLYFKNNV